jgi:phospho-N-acetylmuramoyl-pentapeptide-transferase
MAESNAVQELIVILSFLIGSSVFAFAWSPLLSHLLYKYKVIKSPKVELTHTHADTTKAKTPIMGGILVILTVAIITYAFNWERSFTWVPIGVMLLAAGLGAIDDLLNIYGTRRRNRSVAQVLTLIRVHQNYFVRLWLLITLPWTIIKRVSLVFGSHPGKGVYVHEKLLFQFLAGGIAAWWIYFKLGPAWHFLNIPFIGQYHVGWLIIPIIIFMIMFTANAVNIADGMDGLAGGMLISTYGALALLSWTSGFTELTVLNATVVGALVTYTYFNIKPARFMMGDVGSLGLGALLAINALAIGENVSLLFLAFVFYVEATTVIIQVFGRVLLKRRIFRMAPLHHHFELIGWSEEKTIMRFWIVHALMVLVGIWISIQ